MWQMTREIKVLLIKHLRQGRKRYRKENEPKGPAIKNAVSIDERPAIVDTERFGDWGNRYGFGQTWYGCHRDDSEPKEPTLSGYESRFKIGRGYNQSDDSAPDAIKEHVHTITADNGREFANHEEIAKVLDAKVYFMHPYSSWERGATKNANGFRAICTERHGFETRE